MSTLIARPFSKAQRKPQPIYIVPNETNDRRYITPSKRIFTPGTKEHRGSLVPSSLSPPSSSAHLPNYTVLIWWRAWGWSVDFFASAVVDRLWRSGITLQLDAMLLLAVVSSVLWWCWAIWRRWLAVTRISVSYLVWCGPAGAVVGHIAGSATAACS